MYRLRYVGVPRRHLPEWTLPTYEEIVVVKNGIAYVRKESTVKALLSRGFVLEPEPPAKDDSSKKDAVVKTDSAVDSADDSVKGEAKSREQLESVVIRKFEEGKSIKQIARELNVKYKVAKDIIKSHYDTNTPE